MKNKLILTLTLLTLALPVVAQDLKDKSTALNRKAERLSNLVDGLRSAELCIATIDAIDKDKVDAAKIEIVITGYEKGRANYVRQFVNACEGTPEFDSLQQDIRAAILRHGRILTRSAEEITK